MRVEDRLTQREASCELERLVERMSDRQLKAAHRRRCLSLGSFIAAYAATSCLPKRHDLPRDTVAYLHGLVGRAHNALYRAQGFRFRDWGRILFHSAPRIWRSDPALRLAAAVFVVSFLICALAAAAKPDFHGSVVGERFVEAIDHMYSHPIDAMSKEGVGRDDTAMAGFYIQHNTSIGLSVLPGEFSSEWAVCSNC